MTVKIRFQMHIIILIGVFLSVMLSVSAAQDSVLNKYRLWIINDVETFKRTVNTNYRKQMINIKKAIPGIKIDLRYATRNNFMYKKLYKKTALAYLRSPVVEAISIIEKYLQKQNLGLKIFDAYRPYSVTEKMWELIKDDRYVADPKKGSGHNRGIAVDLTIINLVTKEELNMGTGFDNFSDTAHHDFTSLPLQILQNRMLLKSTMEKYGFKSFESEWWHYSLPDAKDFELLDLSFKQLKRL